jgi:hypothetical protein
MNDVTQLLHNIEQGDVNAAAELLPLVYAVLRRLAAHKMANEPPDTRSSPRRWSTSSAQDRRHRSTH